VEQLAALPAPQGTESRRLCLPHPLAWNACILGDGLQGVPLPKPPPDGVPLPFLQGVQRSRHGVVECLAVYPLFHVLHSGGGTAVREEVTQGRAALFTGGTVEAVAVVQRVALACPYPAGFAE